MRRPSFKLLLVFLLSIGVGYIFSYLFMVFVLESSYRVYSTTLHIVAILLGMCFVIVLDGPLNLKTFEWPTVTQKQASKPDREIPRFVLTISQFLASIISMISGTNVRCQFLASDGMTVIEEFEVD